MNGLSGVQRTKYEDWIDSAQDADYEVVWLQLRNDVRRRFDSQKALSFYEESEGSPYSHRV